MPFSNYWICATARFPRSLPPIWPTRIGMNCFNASLWSMPSWTVCSITVLHSKSMDLPCERQTPHPRHLSSIKNLPTRISPLTAADIRFSSIPHIVNQLRQGGSQKHSRLTQLTSWRYPGLNLLGMVLEYRGPQQQYLWTVCVWTKREFPSECVDNPWTTSLLPTG